MKFGLTIGAPLLFFNAYSRNEDIFQRALPEVGWDLADLLHDIHSFDDFSKYGVVIIQKGDSTDLLLEFAFKRMVTDLFLFLHPV